MQQFNPVSKFQHVLKFIVSILPTYVYANEIIFDKKKIKVLRIFNLTKISMSMFTKLFLKNFIAIYFSNIN